MADLTKPRVLIVDDDEGIRDVLRFLLEDGGYEVIEATDGLVALEILRALPYPVIALSNHNMPRLDGPGLFAFILEDPALASRHVYLYMSAGNRIIDPAFARHLEELSVRVIRKPFDVDTVFDAVSEAAARLRERAVVAARKGRA